MAGAKIWPPFLEFSSFEIYFGIWSLGFGISACLETDLATDEHGLTRMRENRDPSSKKNPCLIRVHPWLINLLCVPWNFSSREIYLGLESPAAPLPALRGAWDLGFPRAREVLPAISNQP
jgi:hypothetical protein